MQVMVEADHHLHFLFHGCMKKMARRLKDRQQTALMSFGVYSHIGILMDMDIR
jgi:isochorismate hydrolase